MTLKALGINQTCFCEFQFKVTGSLRVYIWQSEKDFSEKEGAASLDIASGAKAIPPSTAWLFTVFTSPAISFNLAFSYLLPLQFSMVTQPPMSAKVQSLFKVTEQSDFQENPVVLYATSQLVVIACWLKTFQLRVGKVRNPAGSEAKLIESMLLKTQIPFFVFRMQPLLYPNKVPLTFMELLPTLAAISMLLLIYFRRIQFVLIRFASKFCSKTLMLSEFLRALKVTVQVCMFVETSVKQRSLFPSSKLISLTSFTIANQLLQTVTARETALLIAEVPPKTSNKQKVAMILNFIIF